MKVFFGFCELQVMKTLQEHTRVPCGFAAVNDIRTGKNEDRMDSFVLSETLKCKYFYIVYNILKSIL